MTAEAEPEWQSCYPDVHADGLHDRELGVDCLACGHLVGMHSHARGCVVCKLESQAATRHELLDAVHELLAELDRRVAALGRER